ncbi:hypothetical protein CKA32_000614 [Geitlerinema sp. FC II]|nr:hypothetical protein CKA32_000614 [Geitlerinema sp. FC II]
MCEVQYQSRGKRVSVTSHQSPVKTVNREQGTGNSVSVTSYQSPVKTVNR